MRIISERLDMPEPPEQSSPDKNPASSLADLLGQSKHTLEERVLRQVDGTLNVPDPEPDMPVDKAPQEIKLAPEPILTSCPNCKSKLSAFESKMNHCMACGHAWNPNNDSISGFRVGI